MQEKNTQRSNQSTDDPGYEDGGLNPNNVRLLRRCVDDIEQVLPALSGEALLYFERLSGLGMLVVDQIEE